MDPRALVDVLRDTLVPEKQATATAILDEMHKIIGFVPTLLTIALEESLDISVRQAAVINFKNSVSKFWKEPETPGDPGTFSIHEHDRQAIRNTIVAAMVSAPIPIQSQLKQTLSKIVRIDFPDRFTEFPDQIKELLTSMDQNKCHGALMAFYAFIKVFEFKRNEDPVDINGIVRVFFPLLYSIMVNLIPNKGEESLTLQLLILKILFAYINYHFPCSVMSKESLSQWNDVLCTVLADFAVDSTDSTHPMWKIKKWALRNLIRLLTRYGNPGVVSKKYKAFAEWYMKSFVHQTLTVLLGICELYRQKRFISKPVLSQTLDYFAATLNHAFAWKCLRNDFMLLIREVIFPLLFHSEEDEETWQDDPTEYIRYKSVGWDRDVDPPVSAFVLLKEACTKRRGVLNNLLPFCMHILKSDSSPKEKDAVFHMYGAVAELLLKKEAYKNYLEPFVLDHVVPTLHAAEGYRRARACWLLGELSEAEFKNKSVLCQVVEEVRKILFDDPELPVRAFAAICLSDLLRSQDDVHKVLEPHLRDLFLQLLKLLRETEFDDLNLVIERLVMVFENEIPPIAAEIMHNLCETFMYVIHSGENGFVDGPNERGDPNDSSEYRSVVATSVLDNMESILQVAEENQDLLCQLEPIVVRQIQLIFERDLSLFYDEALNLLFSLTSTKISPLTWQLFDQLSIVFQKDSGDCFSEMMPCLHNFITVDREAFISVPNRVESVANMCAQVIQTSDQDETVQVHAAKLLEVLLLDFRGQINQYAPKFIELALTRLTQPIVSSELRVMCIQVVVSGLLYSPSEVLPVMLDHHWPGTSEPVLSEFLKQWLHEADAFVGLHDRRLFVLGLCFMLSLPAAQRPRAIEAFSKEYLSTLLMLFSGLKRAYAKKARNQTESESDDEEDEDEDLEGKELASDEDEIDDEGAAYLELLDSVEDGSDALISGDDDDEETMMEAFETELDKSECEMEEYVTFYRVMTQLEQSDASWYGQLVSGLTGEQQAELKEVISTAVKCINQKESKMIERAGGYTFQQNIPSNFDFGASPH